MGGDIMGKFAIFRSMEKSVKYRDILDCHVLSGRPTGIKVVFLASSKNGNYADMNIIPQILVFLQTEKFFHIFHLFYAK